MKEKENGQRKPNFLLIMCDQFRFDCIHALGNEKIHTPNLDRLVRRGVSFLNAYSTCPVCVPARYTLRTGREPYHTGYYENAYQPTIMDGQPEEIGERCGGYLATAMKARGYRAFGIGKFHTLPVFKEDCGYDIQLNTEELWFSMEDRRCDDYYMFMRTQHPEYNHIEQLHGERTNMYYVPQVSPFPAELTVEGYVADKTVELLSEYPQDSPYFGFVSFIGPHPPCAPPIPFNRMYNPDKMDSPIRGEEENDLMDEQIRYMNHLIWADEINDFAAKNLKSRYYGEITYIDECIGKILDAVETREDAEDTVICFVADHGDHLGDHGGWQKESYFEQSTKIPFLLSWPGKIQPGITKELVCLTDVFGIATQCAGERELGDGCPVLDSVLGLGLGREEIFACYGVPGTRAFKFMVRKGSWKYIYFSNGGREQLFHLEEDPQELNNRADIAKEIRDELKEIGRKKCMQQGLRAALSGDALKVFSYYERPKERICQFDYSAGIYDFVDSE